jgi:hypothetical protein
MKSSGYIPPQHPDDLRKLAILVGGLCSDERLLPGLVGAVIEEQADHFYAPCEFWGSGGEILVMVMVEVKSWW